MMLQYTPWTSYDSSTSTAAPAGCLTTRRDLGHGILIDVISKGAPGLEYLRGWWDGTKMATDNLLPVRVRWATNAAVARIVCLTGVDSYKNLIYHDGGQGRHQWLNPNMAAFVASQATSPRGEEFSQVSKSVYP